MEVRGIPGETRPAIVRRSCDHCRIACDRASPCSNCTVAKLECKHSPIAARTKAQQQREVPTSKIDTIAEDVKKIRKLLEDRVLTISHGPQSGDPALHAIPQPIGQLHRSSFLSPVQRSNHSAHIRDFVQSLVDDDDLRHSNPKADEIITLLQHVLGNASRGTSSLPSVELPEQQSLRSSNPPLEAVVAALRWIKAASAANAGHYGRITWLSHFLPHENFMEICQKVYFARDDSSLIEQALANGYMSHVFAEYSTTYDSQASGKHHCHCLARFQATLAMLPLLLQPSIETIAALALGAYNATEMSEVETAWTMITNALLQCQRLELHTARLVDSGNSEQQKATQRLFWMVYRLEKGLALRLGRPSTIRDTEITLPPEADEPTYIALARIQGRVYDDLYSPAALQQPLQDRCRIVQDLAARLRVAIHETKMHMTGTLEASSTPLGPLYSQAILVCQASLHVWVLRAVPTADGAASDECISAAKQVMHMHQECMESVRSCTADPYLVTKYVNWAVMHVPFVPFSVLFTHAIQNLSLSDLALLERFAASLKDNSPCSDHPIRPHNLYDLLCKAARLRITSKARAAGLSVNVPDFIFAGNIDFSDPLPRVDEPIYGLRDWYNENQQLMGILDSVVDSRYL